MPIEAQKQEWLEIELGGQIGHETRLITEEEGIVFVPGGFGQAIYDQIEGVFRGRVRSLILGSCRVELGYAVLELSDD